jgi:hypothetical protein
VTETRTYSDGTTATGPAPLPAQSPAQQDGETGPCDKCQGSGKLFDRRIGDIVCDECHGHGWFNEGVAGTAQAAPHEWVCAVSRGGKCTCSVLDAAREFVADHPHGMDDELFVALRDAIAAHDSGEGEKR